MKKILLAASALLGAALAQTSCQAPAPPTPKSEPIAVSQRLAFTSRKPAPAKQTPQPAAQRKVVAQAHSLFPGGFTRFVEKPHLRKVKYGKRRWILV